MIYLVDVDIIISDFTVLPLSLLPSGVAELNQLYTPRLTLRPTWKTLFLEPVFSLSVLGDCRNMVDFLEGVSIKV